MEERKMPNKGNYIALTVLGFLCGVLWGIIDIMQYSPMSKAIEAGDYDEAWARAGKIKLWTIVGVVVNIVAGVLLVVFGQ